MVILPSALVFSGHSKLSHQRTTVHASLGYQSYTLEAEVAVMHRVFLASQTAELSHHAKPLGAAEIRLKCAGAIMDMRRQHTMTRTASRIVPFFGPYILA